MKSKSKKNEDKKKCLAKALRENLIRRKKKNTEIDSVNADSKHSK